MKRTIYICDDCPACDKVTSYIGQLEIQVDIVNINEGGSQAPFISIFPAYFENDKLMAYGEDIVKRLEKAA